MSGEVADRDLRALLRASWSKRHQKGSDERQTAGVERSASSPRRHLRRRLFQRLLRDVEQRGLPRRGDRAAMRAQVEDVVETALADDGTISVSDSDREQLVREVLAEVTGLGPLEPLFADPTISDILVNGPREVWVDRYGRLERVAVEFDDDRHLLHLMSRMVAGRGRHLDEASPSVDVRLEDGSRLHAMIPPLARSPVLSIRRARVVPFRIEELVSYGTMSEEMSSFLEAVVKARLNVLISGGAASGKTTLLNVLGRFIPPHERVVTIEETAELKLEHPHVVPLEARLPNIEGKGGVGLRALIKNALRMRADRIIVGEVRGPEVFDMLQAMNVGHEGSLTTVHANSPGDALRRLESLVLMGGMDLPSRAIRELLGATIDVVVHLTRFKDGSRRVTSISEAVVEAETLTTRELFRLELDADGEGASAGAHLRTDAEPSFSVRVAFAGYGSESMSVRPSTTGGGIVEE